MIYHLIYKDNNTVLESGSKKDMEMSLNGTYSVCQSHYKIITSQELKELNWEF